MSKNKIEFNGGYYFYDKEPVQAWHLVHEVEYIVKGKDSLDEPVIIRWQATKKWVECMERYTYLGQNHLGLNPQEKKEFDMLTDFLSDESYACDWDQPISVYRISSQTFI